MPVKPDNVAALEVPPQKRAVRFMGLAPASRDSVAGGRATHLLWLSVGCLCVLVFALALLRLGRAPLWRDEAWSVAVADRSIPGSLHVVAFRETNMGLYYLLLNVWVHVGGTGESWVRALSLIAAVATIPVVAATARRLTATTSSVLGVSALLAVNPFFLTYAREARAYSLALLLTALSSLLFLRCMERPSAGALTSYAVVLVAAEYTQLLAILVVLPHVLALARRRQLRARRWRLTYAGVVLALLPLAAAVVVNRHNQAGWIPRLSLGTLPRFATALTGDPFLRAGETALIVVALLSAWRLRDHLAAVTAFALVSFLGPIAVVAGLSLRMPLFVDRYLIPVLPALALLVIVGLARVARVRVWVAGAAAAGLVVTSLVVDASIIQQREKVEDLRTAAGWVQSQVHPTDALLYAPAWARVGFEQYAGRDRAAGATDVALVPQGDGVDTGDVLAHEFPSAEVDRRLHGHPRVWIVGYPNDSWTISPEPASMVLAEHQGDWVLLDDRRFGQIDVRLYATGSGGRSG